MESRRLALKLAIAVDYGVETMTVAPDGMPVVDHDVPLLRQEEWGAQMLA